MLRGFKKVHNSSQNIVRTAASVLVYIDSHFLKGPHSEMHAFAQGMHSSDIVSRVQGIFLFGPFVCSSGAICSSPASVFRDMSSTQVSAAIYSSSLANRSTRKPGFQKFYRKTRKRPAMLSL